MVAYYYQRTTALEAEECQESELSQQMAQEAAAVLRHCEQSGAATPVFCHDVGLDWTLDFSERPRARGLFEQLQRGDTVIAWSLSRMFSSCQDTLQTVEIFSERGIKLHVIELGGDICENGVTGNFVSLLTVFAGLEQRRAVERIKLVKQKQRQRGRFLGGSRPFGFMIHENGRLLENPIEQRALKRILMLKQQGQSLRAIASEVSTPMAPISFKTVQRVLQRHAQ